MWWDRFLWQLGFCVCHQDPERMLRFGSRPLFICARDTGILVSLFTSLLVLSLLRRRRRAGMPPVPVLVVGAAGVLFMAWDGFSSYWGWRDSTNAIRFLSGFAAGTGMAFPLAGLLNREVFKGDISLRMGVSPGEWAGVAVSASVLLPMYLWRPAFLFRLGQWWLFLCMLGTFWSLNLLLLSLLRPRRRRKPSRPPYAAAVLLVAAELSVSYTLHRLFSGHGPAQIPSTVMRRPP